MIFASIPLGKRSVVFKIVAEFIGELKYAYFFYAAIAIFLRNVPNTSSTQKFIIGTLHVGGEKRRFTSAVREAKKLPHQLFTYLLWLRCASDFLVGKLLEKLGSQYSGGCFASQIEAAERTKAAGRASGNMVFVLFYFAKLAIVRFAVFT